jgi:hypothetical protein
VKLLGISNTKTLKGESLGYRTYIMHLAPGMLSGFQVCASASSGCLKACLNLSGMGKFSNVQDARIAKTKLFFEDRVAFLDKLVKEIHAAVKSSKKAGLIPVFRLNGTSDIRWENIPVRGYRNLFQLFPDIQFYDYTKHSNRKNIPDNYHLTFSRSETNEDQILTVTYNTAVVFESLPTTYLGLPVVDGTETDLRFLDPQGVIVGLVANGEGKKDTSGFVVRA